MPKHEFDWVRTSFLLRPLLLVALVPLVTLGCSSPPQEGISCTSESRPNLGGSVLDANGNPVVPDRVFLTRNGQSAQCEVQVDPPSYFCSDVIGEVSIIAFAGKQHAERTVSVEADASGCHGLPTELDLVLAVADSEQGGVATPRP